MAPAEPANEQPAPGAPDAPRTEHADRHFVGHARTVMALTMVSRVSGMARDAVCSRVFGGSAIWSAFVTAFIVPNLFRRLFGEGAISAAFIPEYAQLVKRDPHLADRFATLTSALMLTTLGAIVLAIEVVLTLVLLSMGPAGGAPDSHTRVVLIYTMVMLPYAPLVCATAMLGAMLQTHGRFVPHAASPILLNLCMIAAVATLAFTTGADLRQTALGISVAVLVAGVLQLSWCAWSLRSVVTWRRTGADVTHRLRAMMRRLLPVLIGMGTLQLGTLIDGLLAGWPVIVGPVLAFGIAYPMNAGAAGMLFFASRLYQFPLGVFGIAIATAVFPALSRQADEPRAFTATLRRGLRTSAFMGFPATVGLLLVARNATGVIYLGGEFGTEELTRVTHALMAYAPAVWAYSLTHVLTRAFYATGNTRLPMRTGVATVCLNLTLNLILMWPLAESGLALATSIAAMIQCAILMKLASTRLPQDGASLFDPPTARALLWCVLASLAMGACVLGARLIPIPALGWWHYLLALVRDVGVGGLVYVGLALAMDRPELRMLLARRVGGEPSER
jgi:putative peptidoglycan lipid II flippase